MKDYRLHITSHHLFSSDILIRWNHKQLFSYFKMDNLLLVWKLFQRLLMEDPEVLLQTRRLSILGDYRAYLIWTKVLSLENNFEIFHRKIYRLHCMLFFWTDHRDVCFQIILNFFVRKWNITKKSHKPLHIQIQYWTIYFFPQLTW